VRRTITRLVNLYKKKAGVTIPVHINFVHRHIHPPMVTHITLDGLTGKPLHAVISIDPDHFERTEMVSAKSTDIYLRYAISHEISHIKDVERLGSKSFKQSRKKLEAYADREAFKLTNHGGRKTQAAIDRLQKGFRNR